MADLQLAQPASRNLLLPIAAAVLVMTGVGLLLVRLTPHHTAELTVLHTSRWQSHVVFKTESQAVGRDKAQDDLYVLTTLRIEDHLRLPLFVKDLTATMVTASGDTLAASAVEKPDLDPLYTTFPALKTLSSPPLARETTITQGTAAEGMVLLHFPVTQEVWDHRQSATLQVDFYHQAPQRVAIPADGAK